MIICLDASLRTENRFTLFSSSAATSRGNSACVLGGVKFILCPGETGAFTPVQHLAVRSLRPHPEVDFRLSPISLPCRVSLFLISYGCRINGNATQFKLKCNKPHQYCLWLSRWKGQWFCPGPDSGPHGGFQSPCDGPRSRSQTLDSRSGLSPDTTNTWIGFVFNYCFQAS